MTFTRERVRFDSPGSVVDEMENVFKRVRIDENGCWVWLGATSAAGYAQIRYRGELEYVHRLVYVIFVGKVLAGRHIDHLCRNPGCINPAHLELVTPAENTRRGKLGILKTHCINGHPWVPENHYVTPRGGRKCRLCHKDYARKQRERREEEAA